MQLGELEMKIQTNAILREIGRKYLIPTVLAGSIAFGISGCSNELPTSSRYEKEREEMQILTDRYNRYFQGYQDNYHDNLGAIDKILRDAEKNHFLDREIQSELIRRYKTSKGNLEQMKYLAPELSKLGSSTKYPSNIPVQYTRLNELVERNLSGWDIGTPELEKAFSSQGLDIKVERLHYKEKKMSMYHVKEKTNEAWASIKKYSKQLGGYISDNLILLLLLLGQIASAINGARRKIEDEKFNTKNSR